MPAAPRTSRSATGRPTREASEELIRHALDVARSHFIELGFEGTSIEGIAQAAGVSKLTLYRHFETKKGLFLAVLESLVGSYAEQMTARIDTTRPPREVLHDMGSFLAKSYFTPQGQSLTRVLIGEQLRMEDISEHSNRMASLARSPVEGYLKLLQSRGQARFEDLRMAAAQFVNLCMLGQYYLLCDASESIPPARTRARIVRSAVDMFAGAYLADDAGA